MRPIEDWRRKWHRLWSVRLALLAALFDGAAGVWFALADTLPTPAFFAIGAVLPLAAAVARLIDQPSLR